MPRGAAFGRGGNQGQQAAPYLPPARGVGFGRGGFGRGNFDQGNRGGRGQFAARADNRGNVGQRGIFGRARGRGDANNQGGWAQPQQAGNPWGPPAQSQPANPWGVPAPAPEPDMWGVQQPPVAQQPPAVNMWNPDIPPGQGWGDEPQQRVPSPIPTRPTISHERLGWRAPQGVAVPRLPVPVPPVPVEVVVAPQPEIDGNLQLPPPSYDEVMASLSFDEARRVVLLCSSSVDDDTLVPVIREPVDEPMPCRCGDGRRCAECRERGAPSTSASCS